MATELTDAQIRKYKKLRELHNKGQLDPEGIAILEQGERDGDIRKRTFIETLGGNIQGEQGARNLKETGKFVGGAAADATGAELAGRASRMVKLPGKLGMLQKGLETLFRVGGAAGTDRNITQPLIEGVPEDQLSNTQSAISGGAEVLPPLAKGVLKGGKALGGVLAGKGFEPLGDLFRQGIGKAKPLNEVATESGEFVRKTSEDIRLKDNLSGIDTAGLKDTTLEEIGKRNVMSNVASQFRGAILQMMDALATNSFTGKSLRDQASEATQDVLESSVGKFVDNIVTTLNPQQLAEQVTKAVKGNIEFAADLRKMNFKTLDIIGSTVDGFKGVNFNGKIIPFNKAIEILDKASPTGRASILKAMRKAAEEIDAGKQLHKLNPSDEAAHGKLMSEFADIKSLSGNITAQTEKIQESAYSLLTKAVAFNKKTAKLINRTSIEKVANSTPETFLNEFFQSGNIDTLRAVMNLRDEAGKLVLNINQRNGIRSAFLGTIQGNSQFGGKGLLTISSVKSRFVKNMKMLDGHALEANIIAMEDRAGPALGKALFPKQGFTGLRKLAKFLQTQQSVSTGAIGSMSIALGTPAAAGILAATGFGMVGEGAVTGSQTLDLIGAGTIIFGPRGLAKFLDNPKTLDSLLNGVNKFKGKPAALKTWFESFAAQHVGNTFNGTFVSEQDKHDIASVGQARIGGASTNF